MAVGADGDEHVRRGYKYLTPAFLRRWSSFLGQIQRRIRTLNPEEQAVKTMANFLKMSYDFCAEELDG